MIDYNIISDAIGFYESKGYRNIDVPWIVGSEAIDATKPPAARAFDTFAGQLVASGEQSFIQMMLDGKLEAGRYQCCTPCFRDEEVNEWHKLYFLKVELIYVEPFNPEVALGEMMGDAGIFYGRWGLGPQEYVTRRFFSNATGAWEPLFKKTEQGYDIEHEGIELGSYGVRHYKDHTWVYGTGVAEPRASQVRKKYGIGS